MTRQTVLAFDIYGTLLSVDSIVAELQRHLPGDQARAKTIAELWRRHQLEYTWRLNSMGCYLPFDQVTKNALLNALDQTQTTLGDDEIQRLIAAHDDLSAFSDVSPMLERLAETENVVPVIFTNGTSDMVSRSVLRSTSLSQHALILKEVISVNDVAKFKPAPEVYEYLSERVGKKPSERQDVWVISGNPFDVIGARNAGMNSIWVDRADAGWIDRAFPGLQPTARVNNLEQVVEVVTKHLR